MLSRRFIAARGVVISSRALIFCLAFAQLSLGANTDRRPPRYSFPLFCGGIIASAITAIRDGVWPAQSKGVRGPTRELLQQLKSSPANRVAITREGAVVVAVPPSHIVPLSSVPGTDLQRYGQVSPDFRTAFRGLQDLSETLEHLIPLPPNHPEYTVLVSLEDLPWFLAPPKEGFFLRSEEVRAKAIPILSDKKSLRHVAVPVWLALEIAKASNRAATGLFGDLAERSNGPASAWIEMRRVLGVQVKKMKALAVAVPAFAQGEKTRRTDFTPLFRRAAIAHLVSPLEAVFNHVWSREGEILFRPGPTAVDLIYSLEELTKPALYGNNWPGRSRRWRDAVEYGKATLVIDLAEVAVGVSFDDFGPSVASMSERLVAVAAEQFSAWVQRQIGFRTKFVLAAIMEKLATPLPAMVVASIDPRWAPGISSETQWQIMDYLRGSATDDDELFNLPAQDTRSAIHEFFIGHLLLDWGTASRDELVSNFNDLIEHLTGSSLLPEPYRLLQELLINPAVPIEQYYLLEQVEKIIIGHVCRTVRTAEQRAKLRLTLVMTNAALASVKRELHYWLVASDAAFESISGTPSYFRSKAVERVLSFERTGLNQFAAAISGMSDRPWPRNLTSPFDLEAYLEANSAIAMVQRPEDFISVYFGRLFSSLRQPRVGKLFGSYRSPRVREELLAIEIAVFAEPFPRLP